MVLPGVRASSPPARPKKKAPIESMAKTITAAASEYSRRLFCRCRSCRTSPIIFCSTMPSRRVSSAAITAPASTSDA